MSCNTYARRRSPPFAGAPLALLATLLLGGCAVGSGDGDAGTDDPQRASPEPAFGDGEITLVVGGGAVVPLALPEGGSLDMVQGQVLVSLSHLATLEQRDAIEAAITENGGAIIGQVGAARALQVDLGEGDVWAFVEAVETLPGLLSVTPNFAVEMARNTQPPTGGEPGEWWLTAVGAFDAWDVSVGASDVPMAVVDTFLPEGSGHLDSANTHVFETTRLVNGCAEGDDCDHGVGVAALAGSPGDDGFGSAGMAWDSPILFVDAFQLGDGKASASDLLAAVEQALTGDFEGGDGAKLISLGISAGATPAALQRFREALTPAVQMAADHRALVFLAAGNAGVKDDDQLLPTAGDPREQLWRENAVIVTASDRADRVPPFANEGAAVDLAAPGVDVTFALGNGDLELGSGTSLAVPIAMGAGALIWDALDRDDPRRVKGILQEAAADPLIGAGAGAGIVDADGSIREALKEAGIIPTEADATELATAIIFGADQGDQAGRVFVLGEVDGDRRADFLVTSPTAPGTSGSAGAGAAYLFIGRAPMTGTFNTESAVATFRGDTPGGRFGEAAAPLGDLDGDERMDFAILEAGDGSFFRPGAIHVFLGKDRQRWVGTISDPRDVAHRIPGTRDRLLKDATLVGTLPDDSGRSDLIVGAPHAFEGGRLGGALYVFRDRSDWDGLTLADADLVLVGENGGDRAGTSIAVLGDLMGDGDSWIAVGAPGHDAAGPDSGRVYLLSLSDYATGSGVRSLASARFKFNGETRYDGFGETVASAGDLDEDERPELMIGAPGADYDGSDRGMIYLYVAAMSGLWDGNTPAAMADVSFVGEASGDRAGTALAAIRESVSQYNGIAIGAPGNIGGNGAVYLIEDPLRGECRHGLNLGDHGFKLRGDVAGGRLGTYLDSYPEDDTITFLVGAPNGQLSGAAETGLVYLYTGPLDRLIARYANSEVAGCDTRGGGGSPAPWALAALTLVGLQLIRRRRGALLATAALVAGGCAVSGGDGDPNQGTPADTETELGDVGEIGGRAIDGERGPIAGADVLLDGQVVAVTDADGAFTIDLGGMDASAALLEVSAEGYAPGWIEVPLAGAGAVLTVELVAPALDGAVAVDNSQGGIVQEDGAIITLPPGMVYADTGAVVDGDVTVELVTYYPGKGVMPVQTMTEVPTDEEPLGYLIQSLGMVGVWLTADGREVQLAEGTTARIEIPGAERYTHAELDGARFGLTDGDGQVSTAPLYLLEDGDTHWTRVADQGWDVVPSSDPDFELSFATDVEHFTYWNIDVRVPATCLTGRVFTRWGEDVYYHPSTLVATRGYNSSGGEWHTWTYSGAGGRYCVRVGADTPNMQVWFDKTFSGNRYQVVRFGSTPPVDREISCGDSRCTVMDHEIPCGWFEERGLSLQ